MASSKHVLSLKGFEDMLADIERTGKNVDRAAEKALHAGAAEYEKALRAECAAANVPDSITREIETRVEMKNNRYRVSVGWELGEYNPAELSQGYKALFLNYGTPHRKAHGKIKARGFIGAAKKKSKKKIKAAQAAALEEILRGLE